VLTLGLNHEHDVQAVTSAREALALVSAGNRYDVILCDLMMPEMTGAELFTALRTLSADHAQRMVFITGGVFTPATREFLDSVPNRCLQKPFGLDDVSALVRELSG
jgi:CheY-like chemotaxis protein